MLATEEEDDMLIKYAVEGNLSKVESLLNLKFEFSVLLHVYKLTYCRGIKLYSNKIAPKNSLLEQGQTALQCALLIYNQLETFLYHDQNKFRLAMVLCKTNDDIFKNFVTKYKFNYNQVYRGKSLLHKACRYENVEIVKFLLNQNINVNQQTIWDDVYHQTPLHIAVTNFNVDIIKLLLSKKCNPNIVDYYKKPPIYYVSPGENGNMIIFEMLIRGGANINYKHHEQTLLCKAINDNCLMTVNYLLSLNASPFIPSLNILTKLYQTPLELACIIDNDKIIEALNQNIKLYQKKISNYYLC